MANSRPDMGAVGNAASTTKKGSSSPLVLKSINVDFSDNGGATIREIRERKVPEGRRAGAGFPMGSDVKENTFENMARARAHLFDLMGGAAPAAPAAPVPPRPAAALAPPTRPPMPAPRPMPMPMPTGGGGPLPGA